MIAKRFEQIGCKLGQTTLRNEKTPASNMGLAKVAGVALL